MIFAIVHRSVLRGLRHYLLFAKHTVEFFLINKETKRSYARLAGFQIQVTVCRTRGGCLRVVR